jgi:predicted branched-subunit amino acid permease
LVLPLALSAPYPGLPPCKPHCWQACYNRFNAQFLFYSLWAAGAEVASVVFSVFLVNLRYLLMSSAMSVFREHSTLQKLVSGLLLTDETFGVAVQRGSQQYRSVCLDAWLNSRRLA